MTLNQIVVDAGVLLTLATNVAGFARTLRGQDRIEVKVNGNLGWLMQRADQLARHLTAHGLQPPPPATPPPGEAADSIDP